MNFALVVPLIFALFFQVSASSLDPINEDYLSTGTSQISPTSDDLSWFNRLFLGLFSPEGLKALHRIERLEKRQRQPIVHQMQIDKNLNDASFQDFDSSLGFNCFHLGDFDSARKR